jgi:carbon monoxide dehydrogenase subunit G
MVEFAMKISYSIEIDSKPEEVFRWIKDPERAMVWMSSVSKYEILHETPNMVGTTGREIVEENGRCTELQVVVTAYKPNRLISFHLSGEFNSVDVEYRLEEIEDRTRLTWNADIRFKSFVRVLSLFMGATFKKKIMDQSKAEFTKLKELCEQGASG